jgi:hypothetical protein
MPAIAARLGRAWISLHFLRSRGAAGLRRWLGIILAHGLRRTRPGRVFFARFLNVIQQYNASGERFRIDSHCQSACTMFLSIRNVCVTPGATLLFHAGGSMQKGIISPAYTQQMLDTYNGPLRQYVSDNHFMDTFDFHPISGRDIVRRFGYPACR